MYDLLFINTDGKPMSTRQVNAIIAEADQNAGIEGKRLVAKTFRKSLVKHALEECEMYPLSLIGTGKQVKTCFCVGWLNMDVLMEHYTPRLQKLMSEIDRNSECDGLLNCHCARYLGVSNTETTTLKEP